MSYDEQQKSDKADAEELAAEREVRPLFFLFFVLQFFLQQVSVGGRNENKNKIHSNHFPIELKSKETQLCFLRL